jgi:hypothetical protein
MAGPVIRAQQNCHLCHCPAKVVDEKGSALPGATAQIKKLSLGEATNEAGIIPVRKTLQRNLPPVSSIPRLRKE